MSEWLSGQVSEWVSEWEKCDIEPVEDCIFSTQKEVRIVMTGFFLFIRLTVKTEIREYSLFVI